MAGSDWRDVSVLVTGGAGFIGSHLVDALVARGARVRVLDDLSTGFRRNLAGAMDAIEWIEGDVRDAGTCRRAAEGVRRIFHLAALGSIPRSMRDPASTFAVNVGGSANVFAAARDAGAERVVYASSSSVYGDSSALPKREGEEGRPLSPYARSKAMNEDLAETFGSCFGLELIGLRYFNVYGPRQTPDGAYAAVIPLFFRAALEGRAPRIHGDGLQSRDFTFVDDVVRANLLAAEAPAEACGRVYNVAPGRSSTVVELAAAIRGLAAAEGIGAPPPEHGPPRPGDVRHSKADPTRAREAFGFEAEVELTEGLRRSFEHYRRDRVAAPEERPEESA